MAEAPRVRAVILVGGPTRATRFRPLSFNLPKPLFPLAGKPMIWHHIEACKRELPGLVEVLLLGSFNPTEFQGFVEQTQEELKVPIEFVFS
jgi:mannose-1-phosphate guanylyltransferase